MTRPITNQRASDHPSNHSFNQLPTKPTFHSINHSPNQLFIQPIAHQTNHIFNQLSIHLTNQTFHPTNQPTNQLASELLGSVYQTRHFDGVLHDYLFYLIVLCTLILQITSLITKNSLEQVNDQHIHSTEEMTRKVKKRKHSRFNCQHLSTHLLEHWALAQQTWLKKTNV